MVETHSVVFVIILLLDINTVVHVSVQFSLCMHYHMYYVCTEMNALYIVYILRAFQLSTCWAPAKN